MCRDRSGVACGRRGGIYGGFLCLWIGHCDRHRAFDSLREAMLPTDKSEITGIATEMVGDWWVIRVGSDVAEQFLERGSNPEAGALNSGVGKDNG